MLLTNILTYKPIPRARLPSLKILDILNKCKSTSFGYLGLSLAIFGYLGLSWSGYLWLSWTISNYLELSQAISGYFRLSWGYQVSSRSRREQVVAISKKKIITERVRYWEIHTICRVARAPKNSIHSILQTNLGKMSLQICFQLNFQIRVELQDFQ